MTGMKDTNHFLVVRYIVFALFTICNAITCSVAVWNSSLVRSGQLFQVDIYLIFLGAFSLAFIFTLIFIELFCVHAVTTRAWFECAWVALFWVMELAGGAALIAIESDVTCSRLASVFLNTLCTSERVLLAFTWLCTVMLFVYLLALVFIVMSQHPEAPRVWNSDVRGLRAATLRPCSSSISSSPLTTRFQKRASVDIYSPQPARSQPVHSFHHRRGPSAEYEIEPFRTMFSGPEQMDVPYPSNLPEAIPLPPLAAAPLVRSYARPIPLLHQDAGNGQSLLLSQVDTPLRLASTIAYSGSASLPSRPAAGQSSTVPLSSPLGSWPRRDIMQLPVKPKHKRRPPSSSELPDRHIVPTDRPLVPPDMVTQPRPRRPSGPRLRAPSLEGGRRPTPLDLSGISNYETGRRES